MVTTTNATQGWYLYGITRSGPRVDEPLQLLEFSGLAAVVTPVSLADFSSAALRERMQDASVLESTVRDHNRVVETIHAAQAILPAKFGLVYTNADDVVASLQRAHDTLLDQLNRLDRCDEWAVHLYANRAAQRERISTGDPAIQLLREQRAAARPGRAYFIEQQLRVEVDVATAQALWNLAQSAFGQLSAHAVSGQLNPIKAGTAADDAGEVEIMRASFLVARDGAERFKAEARSIADTSAGTRCEYSGPWPPYSFAERADEEAA
ncbi:MAG: GvpL/GvpF family gas vesicle protein [Gemmatimonadaceae bacterium]